MGCGFRSRGKRSLLGNSTSVMLRPMIRLPLLASALERKPSTGLTRSPRIDAPDRQVKLGHRAVDQMARLLTPQSEHSLLHRSGYEHSIAMCVLIEQRHYWLFRPIVRSEPRRTPPHVVTHVHEPDEIRASACSTEFCRSLRRPRKTNTLVARLGSRNMVYSRLAETFDTTPLAVLAFMSRTLPFAYCFAICLRGD
jgi:hypothetical protein